MQQGRELTARSHQDRIGSRVHVLATTTERVRMTTGHEAAEAATHDVAPAAGSARLSLVDQAHAALKAAITAGEFAPGTQLSAQVLAQRLGTSRTPIHEACLRLQEEGLVKILPKKGILVTALSPEDIREIYEVIIAIEGDAAARLAGLPEAERMPVADELAALTDAMAAAAEFAPRSAADMAFHRLLVAACGNARFAAILAQVNSQAARARVFMVQLRPDIDRSVPEHRAIIAAIRAGEPDAACAAARAHRSRVRDDIVPMLARFGLKHL